MNDPVVPVMPSTQVPPPPSYLRPPQQPSSFREKKKHLMLWTGIAATVLIVWGFMLFGGTPLFSLTPTNTGPLKGSLALVSPAPELGIYTYQFGVAAPSLVSWEDGRDGAILTGASFSPSGAYVAETVTDNSIDGAVYVLPPSGGSRTLVFSRDKTIFSFPVVSNDGTQVAFLASPGQLLYAKRTGETFSVSTLTKVGTPLAFSPSGADLLLAQKGTLVVLSLADFSTKTLQGYTSTESRSVVAISPDGMRAALYDGEKVLWGNVDWTTRTFTPVAELATEAAALLYSSQNELIVVNGANLARYILKSRKAVAAGSAQFAIPLHPDARALAWQP